MACKAMTLLLLAGVLTFGHASGVDAEQQQQPCPADHNSQVAGSSCTGSANDQADTAITAQTSAVDNQTSSCQTEPDRCDTVQAEQQPRGCAQHGGELAGSVDGQHGCQNPHTESIQSDQIIGQAGRRALLEALLQEAGGTDRGASEEGTEEFMGETVSPAAATAGASDQTQMHGSRNNTFWDVGSSSSTAMGRKLTVYSGRQYTRNFPMEYVMSLTFDPTTVATKPQLAKLSNPQQTISDPEVAAFGQGLLTSMEPILGEYYMTAHVDSYSLGNPVRVRIVMFTSLTVGNQHTDMTPDSAERLELLEQTMNANNAKEAAVDRLAGLLSSQNATAFMTQYSIVDLTVQSSPSNQNSIDECDDYVDQLDDMFWTGHRTALKTALVVVLPTVGLLVLAVRLFSAWRAKRLAHACTTASRPDIMVGPMTLGGHMQVAAPASNNSAYYNAGGSSDNYNNQAALAYSYPAQGGHPAGASPMQQLQQRQQYQIGYAVLQGYGAPAAATPAYTSAADQQPVYAYPPAVTSPFQSASAQQQPGMSPFGWQSTMPSAAYGK